MGVIVGAAIVSCVGIVVAASGAGTLGGVITVAGWIAFIGAIHRLGRSGKSSKLGT